MRKRILSGIVVASIITAAIFFSGIFWGFAVLAIAIACNFELNRLFAAKGYQQSPWLTTAFCVFFLVATGGICLWFQFTSPETISSWQGWSQTVHSKVIAYQNLALAIAIISAFALALFKVEPRTTIGDISTTILTIVYLGWLPSYLILLRLMPHGGEMLFWVIVSVALSDIMAYFTGRFLGKTPFFPFISPKKTREGAFGGLMGAVFFAWLLGSVLPIPWGANSLLGNIPWYHSVALGLLVGAVGIIGDLSESLLKRDAGIKDSGDVIPGHGGILDRVDSYLFVGVVAYYYIVLFIN